MKPKTNLLLAVAIAGSTFQPLSPWSAQEPPAAPADAAAEGGVPFAFTLLFPN